MPFRYAPTGAAITAKVSVQTAAWSSRRFFHASPRVLHLDSNTSDTSNHYETLNVRPDASPAEIKRSFYLLSKRHHPDHNPSDPHAPSRFMRISEAYATLSHADKRARYDRDVMRTSTRNNNNPHYHHAPKGSYHSTGPAGGRPASGLSSRRRGTYQGPPPSFFRSGGWGAHTAKRRAAHEESTGFGAGYGTDSSRSGSGAGGAGQQPPPPPPPPHGSGGGGGGTGGMGPGQDPFGHRDDVPHFDREAHERAQRRGEEMRARRAARRAGLNPDEPDSPTNMSFFAVAAILAVVVMAPLMVSGNRNRRSGSDAQVAEKEREREKKAK
ncbi:DnaJ subfamily A member 3, mitochondrial [Achaetomium macrosporum]|uniref:DnaJ subfamily A member 3, mitochondrial n=1 Tax=Achaetomium macrosporum TaxID=79813 RepID=A0AAN7CHK4_9PEZI|nr:DnaJ subfamily A member 3, mitochondrial [Achaetomium macrosporum]